MEKYMTWDEMFAYLKSVPNCRINGKGWSIMDKDLFLTNAQNSVNSIPPDQRSKNLNCRTLKGCLLRAYHAVKEGSIDEPGKRYERNPFGIFGG